MTILQHLLLIALGGLLALAGTLLATVLQTRRERMRMDREDQRAATQRAHTRSMKRARAKQEAYLAFATAIHHASLALDEGPPADERLRALMQLHEAVLLVAPEQVRQATRKTLDLFLYAREATAYRHLQEKRKGEVAQSLADFRRLAREDLGLHEATSDPAEDTLTLPEREKGRKGERERG